MPGSRERLAEPNREEKEPREKGEENIVESTVFIPLFDWLSKLTLE